MVRECEGGLMPRRKKKLGGARPVLATPRKPPGEVCQPMNLEILIALALLSGCAVHAYIPRDAACHEQADAWCRGAGFPDAPGCTVWYVHECEPSGPDSYIDAEMQYACLDEIAAGRTPDREPAACIATWGAR